MDRQQEFDNQIREFLRQLDACKTEEQRIEKVAELIHGITRAVRRLELEKVSNTRED